MHELSLILSVVHTCKDIALKNNTNEISEVLLEIGTLANIEPNAFNMAWKEGTKNSILKNSKLKINWIKAEGECMECNHIFPMNQLFDSCPNCNSYFININKGKEFKIKSLLA